MLSLSCEGALSLSPRAAHYENTLVKIVWEKAAAPLLVRCAEAVETRGMSAHT